MGKTILTPKQFEFLELTKVKNHASIFRFKFEI